MQNQIFKYIAYFDIFDHPVKLNEIVSVFSSETKESIKTILLKLVDSGKCYEYEDYFSLKENIEELTLRRSQKEALAKPYFKKLGFYSRLIKSFPFVEGIAISGSLSKNVMHENGDIDFFIIASKGRLWICRTFLVFFKKIFLFNSKKYFCVNYFVDTDNLKIQDENIFTAIELRYLLPVYNLTLIDELKKANNWTNDYLPPFENPVKVKVYEGFSVLKKFSRFILKGKLGDKIDLYLMKFTFKKWEKKFSGFDTRKFELTMRTNRGVSKHHPQDFQNKVLTAFEDRISKFADSK